MDSLLPHRKSAPAAPMPRASHARMSSIPSCSIAAHASAGSGGDGGFSVSGGISSAPTPGCSMGGGDAFPHQRGGQSGQRRGNRREHWSQPRIRKPRRCGRGQERRPDFDGGNKFQRHLGQSIGGGAIGGGLGSGLQDLGGLIIRMRTRFLPAAWAVPTMAL